MWILTSEMIKRLIPCIQFQLSQFEFYSRFLSTFVDYWFYHLIYRILFVNLNQKIWINMKKLQLQNCFNAENLFFWTTIDKTQHEMKSYVDFTNVYESPLVGRKRPIFFGRRSLTFLESNIYLKRKNNQTNKRKNEWANE
jgi:hypothetical protein